MGYRRQLRKEFERRKRKNARYSLRAFARDLDVGVATISSCLAEKRHLSPMNLRKLQRALSWSDEAIQNALGEITQQTKPIRASKTHDYPTELFSAIANWYTLAILNLARMPSNKATPEWIADRLNISIENAKASLQRLLHLKLIRVHGSRLYLTDEASIRFTKDLPEAGVRKLQTQISTQACNSLEEVNWPHRLFYASLFNGDRGDLKNTIPKIHRFGANMKRSLNVEKGQDVLGVVVHVFPLTKK